MGGGAGGWVSEFKDFGPCVPGFKYFSRPMIKPMIKN